VCFSPQADFTSAAVIGTVGVATLTKVEHPRELALGVLPLAFALHQAVEGFVWLGLQGNTSKPTSGVAVYLYVAFAWVILPVLAPLAVLLVERNPLRRRVMGGFVALGGATGLYLLSSILRDNVTAHAVQHTIQYGGAGDFATLATVCYVVATCTPPILSSYRPIQLFGILDLGAVGLIVWAQQDGLTSVWCAWAAVVSVLIYFQFTRWRRPHPRDDPAVVRDSGH